MDPLVTPHDFECAAAERMRELGFPDAKPTTAGADGGIDVQAVGAIAQVKNWNRVVGRPSLQQLFGARGANSAQRMLFFAKTGYARPAREYADTHAIALFVFDHAGAITAANGAARELQDRAPTARVPASDRKTTRPSKTASAGSQTTTSSPRTVSAARKAPTSSGPAETEKQKNLAHFLGRAIKTMSAIILGLSSSPSTIHTDRKAPHQDSSISTDSAVMRIRMAGNPVEVRDLETLPKASWRCFLSGVGYSADARDYAKSSEIALFKIDMRGDIKASSGRAHALLRASNGPKAVLRANQVPLGSRTRSRIISSYVTSTASTPPTMSTSQVVAEVHSHLRQLGFETAPAHQSRPYPAADTVIATDQVVTGIRVSGDRVGLSDIKRLRATGYAAAALIYFSRVGFTEKAVAYAKQLHVGLFAVDSAGVFSPVNSHARARYDTVGPCLADGG